MVKISVMLSDLLLLNLYNLSYAKSVDMRATKSALFVAFALLHVCLHVQALLIIIVQNCNLTICVYI